MLYPIALATVFVILSKKDEVLNCVIQFQLVSFNGIVNQIFF